MPESLTAYLSLVSALTVIYTGLSRRLLARASNKRSTLLLTWNGDNLVIRALDGPGNSDWL